MKISLALALLIVLPALAACAAADPVPPPPTSDVYSAETSPTHWDRSPSAIVFRADVTGGKQDEFFARSEVPSCTVYGDNRVVWTNELGPYNVQVLYDQMSDTDIKQFADSLIMSEHLYDYGARANLQVPSASRPAVEFMELNVNDTPYRTDAFSGWEYDYYLRILDRCRTVSRAPVLFLATEGWLSARTVTYSSDLPMILWDKGAAGLSFAEIASGAPRWIADSNVPILWNILRTAPVAIQFIEDNQAYQIALQVPNVTRDSPPAPGSEVTPAPTP